VHHHLLGQVAGASENFNNQLSFLKTTFPGITEEYQLPYSNMFFKDQTTTQPKIAPPKTDLSIYHPCTSMFLCHLQLFLTSFPSSSFLPLQFINAGPLLTIIHTAFLLYYKSHTPRERPPHAFHAHCH